MRPLLLIEDDYDVREALTEVLRDAGYSVVWASDGADAMRALRGGLRPAAILLDLMMPVMDGFQFRAEQESDPALADIPVIVVTADRTIDRDARELHAAGRLTKPARLDEVLAVVSRVAGR